MGKVMVSIEGENGRIDTITRRLDEEKAFRVFRLTGGYMEYLVNLEITEYHKGRKEKS